MTECFLFHSSRGFFTACSVGHIERRALEELFDRPIEIYSSEAEDLRPMKIDFDASGVSFCSANRSVFVSFLSYCKMVHQAVWLVFSDRSFLEGLGFGFGFGF